MSLHFMGWSPTLGSVLTAYSLEPASNFVSPSLSAPSLGGAVNQLIWGYGEGIEGIQFKGAQEP